jgi:hypothetical protein
MTEIGIIQSPFKHAGQPHQYVDTHYRGHPEGSSGMCGCGEPFSWWGHFISAPYKLGEWSRFKPLTMTGKDCWLVLGMVLHEVNEIGDMSWFVLCMEDGFQDDSNSWYVEEWDARVDPADYDRKVTPAGETQERFMNLRAVHDFGTDVEEACRAINEPWNYQLIGPKPVK